MLNGKISIDEYISNSDSGQPVVGMANTSGLGRVLSNSLELSNVDLAEEFVKMISAQRGFQANSRIISTTDEMLQELINLNR
jgi:flagellar hook protein FlgE